VTFAYVIVKRVNVLLFHKTGTVFISCVCAGVRWSCGYKRTAFFDMRALLLTAAACVNETYAKSYVFQRDLDIRGQLETLTSRLSGKIRNVTCVMQELGYVSVDCFLNIREERV
jgi:hypothetical protein